MKTRTIASLIACSFLLVLLQLVAVLIQPIAGVVCGALLAIVSLLLLKFFQVELSRQWVRVLLPTASSALAIALVFFTKPGPEVYLWFAPLLALAVSGVIVAAQHFGSKRCGLCGRRLRGRVAFPCPRCGLTVCDHTCWVFEASRCRLCEQNRVPIFTPDGRWWDRQLGPKMQQGRCQLCQTPAQEADLRPCRQCGRPQCRECWDATNGQCSRCQWTIEDLPDSLRPYILAKSGDTRVSVRAR
jgi:Prokaryotic RING finger family 2